MCHLLSSLAAISMCHLLSSLAAISICHLLSSLAAISICHLLSSLAAISICHLLSSLAAISICHLLSSLAAIAICHLLSSLAAISMLISPPLVQDACHTHFILPNLITSVIISTDHKLHNCSLSNSLRPPWLPVLFLTLKYSPVCNINQPPKKQWQRLVF
jgi:hypothetical protein